LHRGLGWGGGGEGWWGKRWGGWGPAGCSALFFRLTKRGQIDTSRGVVLEPSKPRLSRLSTFDFWITFVSIGPSAGNVVIDPSAGKNILLPACLAKQVGNVVAMHLQ